MSLYDETSFYEIVELENGDVSLRRSQTDAEGSLVEIRFSEESRYFLGKARFDVAKTMIEAGLDLVAELSDDSDTFPIADLEASPVIH